MKRGIEWAAGLFEGEGSVGAYSRSRSLRASLGMTDEDIVRRFRTVVGIGNVHGPRAMKTSTRPMYFWQASRFEHVQSMFCWFWQYLGSRRRAQYAAAVRKYMDLPRVRRRRGSGRAVRENGYYIDWKKRRADIRALEGIHLA
jgi:hypothetical protein